MPSPSIFEAGITTAPAPDRAAPHDAEAAFESPYPAADEQPGGPWCYSTLCARAAIDSLSAIADYVRSVAYRGGAGEQAGLRLRLAVEELAVNTIVHGYGAGCGWLVLDGGGDGRASAWVRLRDTAPPFDPAAARREVRFDLPVKDRPVGGLGIHLAITSADEYGYEYVNGENRSTLTVRRRQDES